ncbi:NADH:ubiquinone oxidoreductase subunit N, partial [Burkholderia pseudomallei]
MQNGPMNVLLPDALVMAAIIVAWLNDTFVGAAGRRRRDDRDQIREAAAGVWFALQALDPQQYYFFSRSVVVDSFASAMKAVVSIGLAVTLAYATKYHEDRHLFRGDVFRP